MSHLAPVLVLRSQVWYQNVLIKRAALLATQALSLASVSAGLTVAEHFRDVEGQDVLLFIDNIFRFTQVIFVVVLFVVSQPCQLLMEQALLLFFSQVLV